MKYKEELIILLKAIVAGLLIGIGGTVFLSLENKIVGSFLFGIGLFVIVSNNLNLYTGKIGYIVNNDLKFIKELILTLIGNFIGTNIVGLALRTTRIYDSLLSKAKILCQIKLDDNLVSIFVLAIFCGMLMYIAVNGYKTYKDSIGKNIIIFLAVMVFILCGFEHCVANMYYFAVANMYTAQVFGYLLVMILGNSVGAILLSLTTKIKN